VELNGLNLFIFTQVVLHRDEGRENIITNYRR